jgi:HlyD family secretion protein
VGLVGSTGCGKTTLIDIILGLLTPESGKISLDDIEINSNNKSGWQKQIGYVPQSIYLTDDTIIANIAFAIPYGEISSERVEKAAKMANLHDFIEKLPDQYETFVGERGIRLSGGQRQRIGIARALYHNPNVLILDEATSSLDAITENVIMDAIHNLSHKKTIIMIAHRLSTVKECDVIHFISDGRIIDSGTYQHLIVHNKEFKKMAKNL